MSDVIVDSSVVAKWFLSESDTALAEKVMTDTLSSGGRVVVVDLVFAEVGNIIWKKHRQKLITLDEARGAIQDVRQAPVHAEQAARIVDQALEIAIRHDRTVYDALLVALSEDLALNCITADERFYNAMHPHYPRLILLRDWT